MRQFRGLRAAATFALLFTGAVVEAGTYYIDYSGGSDANDGASKTSPWKRHPYMKGFAGAYKHAAGDRFIFKGGVTWPVTAFQMRITAGGSSDSNRDYYGVDQAWYAGAAWTRPLFDFQNTLVGTGWTAASGVNVDSVSYITFDGLELANHRAPLSVNGVSSWGTCSLVINNAASYVTVTNCVVRDWDLPTPVPSGSDGGGGIWYVGSGGGKGIVVANCVLHQAGTPVKCGRALSFFGEVAYTEVYQTPNAFLGSGVIHDNHFHHLVNPTDPSAHPNAIETFGPSRVYGNLIHDLASGVAAIFLGPDWSGGSGIDLVYNNVVYNCGYQAPIQLDTGGANPGQIGVRAYNNTLEHGGTYCIRVVERSGAVYGVLEVRNNHLITSGTPYLYNNPAGGGANVKSVTIANNLVQTPAQANGSGYSSANHYAPTAGTSPSVNIGLDLSSVFGTDIRGSTRPAGNWDVGAYEYTGSIPKANAAPVVAPIQTITADASPSDPGLQVSEGARVTLSSTVTDAEGDPVTWNWAYSIDGGPETLFASGADGAPAATYTYTSGSGGRGYLWTLRANDGFNTVQAQFAIGVLPSSGASIEAETAVVTPPMTISGGYIVQNSQTTLANGGRATYTFSVPEAGEYTVAGVVEAASDASNSFYVSIDSDPQDPTSVWHIPVTSGFERRTVSWQGDGTWDQPAFVPKYFTLASGTHTLIVVGREAGVKLDRILILKTPAPPRNLRVATGI